MKRKHEELENQEEDLLQSTQNKMIISFQKAVETISAKYQTVQEMGLVGLNLLCPLS